jgi:signal transduction histidine kinase
MSIFALSCLLTGITALSLGYFVFVKDRMRKLNWQWFIFSLAVSVWGFGSFWFSTAKTADEALLAWRLTFAFGVVWIPVSFQFFVYTFCKIQQKKALIASTLIGLIFFPIIFTKLFFSDVRWAFSSFYYSTPGLAFPAFVAWWFGTVIYNHVELIKAYGASSPQKKNQIKYFFSATAIGFTGGSTCYLPIFGFDLYPILNYSVPLYPVIMAYAIARHQLMDIRTVIHKTAMWTVTSSLYVVPIGLVLYATKPQIDKLPLWLFLLMIAGLFLLNIPYMRIVQPKIDHLFQRRKYDLRTVLDRFIRDVAIVKSIHELSEKLVGTIRRVLYAEPTTLLVWHPREDRYAATDGSIGVSDDDAWLVWLGGHKQMVDLSEVTAGPDRAAAEAARAYAAKTHALFCLPLHRDGLLVGVVNIGPKRNLQRYSQPEREFLETLRAEASIALTNSLLYDEVTQMSEELRQWGLQLEHKVEERTQELKAALHQLKETESQLIQSEKLAAHGLLAAGVLHEINNPLSFSRGSLSVLKRALARVKEASQGSMGPLLAEVERAAEIIQNGHERIAAIVRDLKTFARRDVEGIKLSDLHQGLDATLSLLRHELGDRIAVVREYGDIGLVETDSAQINQVFLNLLHNALQAISGDGLITIRTWCDEGRVYVSIKDTGTGIDPEDLPRIFEPFFTTKPVGHGTGLGLSVSHRIIREHGGQMTVHSQIGEGTEFVIELPVRQLAAAHAVR